jgi:FkbM family methyltransferase
MDIAANLRITRLLPAGIRELAWRLRYLPKGLAWPLVREVSFAYLLPVLRAFYSEPVPVEELFAIRVRGYRHPIYLRVGTSDVSVFGQMFLQRQYGGLPIANPRVIFDGGANIGLASLFFLNQYPNARIIAIEPDYENYCVAERNLYPYRDRCSLMYGALWSERTRLALKKRGAHWESQVEACQPGLADRNIEAYSLSDIRQQFTLSTIDLLKVDIEGAEIELLQPGRASMLDDVRCCAIELHGDHCVEMFTKEARRQNFHLSRRNEITIAHRCSRPWDFKSNLPGCRHAMTSS